MCTQLRVTSQIYVETMQTIKSQTISHNRITIPTHKHPHTSYTPHQRTPVNRRRARFVPRAIKPRTGRSAHCSMIACGSQCVRTFIDAPSEIHPIRPTVSSEGGTHTHECNVEFHSSHEHARPFNKLRTPVERCLRGFG